MRLQLSAERVHVHLDQVVVGVVAPHLAEELALAHDLAAVPHEYAQHLELDRGQRHRTPRPGQHHHPFGCLIPGGITMPSRFLLVVASLVFAS